jgi:hypothetical protein
MAKENNSKAAVKIRVNTPQFVGTATAEEVRRFYLEK